VSLIQDLVVAYRALAEHGVIDAYGHASVRSETNPQRYYMSRAVAPEIVTEADILELDLDSRTIEPTPHGLYQERFIHGEIYKVRPDVNAIVHNHSPSVVPFSCTGCEIRPIFHMAAFIGLGVPNWDIRDAQKGTDMLVKTAYLGEHLAKSLGKFPAVLMRGHGSTVVAENIQRAVGRTIYLEQNARMQYQAIQLAGRDGKIVYLDDDEVNANISWQNYVRSWDLWKRRALATLEREKAAR
jgi:HCOMODA/2-hydroxy-3-carboxy-muconic semialdehyde decarboxylase